MNLQIGKAYRLKSGLIVRLQGLSRGLVHHADGEVKHFVEISFRVIGTLDEFVVRTPLVEILPNKSSDDKQRIMNVAEAIVQGTPIPLTAPHALRGPDESP